MQNRLLSDELAAIEALRSATAGLRVGLGHDWLTGMRGGERVLEYFCRAWPDAVISSVVGDKTLVSDVIASHPLSLSPLSRLPSSTRIYRKLLPLLPWAALRTRVPECDLLLTTSHCVAKGFRKGKGAKHICVCFTPMRYAWTFYNEYFGSSRVKALVVKPMLSALRHWDVRTASGVDSFVAISKHVAKRITDFYGRDSVVAYPPVDLLRCTPDPDVSKRGTGGYDLIVSALVPYKRVDLAVRLYSRTGRRLKVVGAGGCERELRRIAGSSVEIMGRLSDAQILELYRGCRFLLFPGEEDYGIVPLEAQACGRPVIAYGKGGALETVVSGVSGVFFEEQTEDSLAAALEHAESIEWNCDAIRANAERFGPAQFLNAVAAEIKRVMA